MIAGKYLYSVTISRIAEYIAGEPQYGNLKLWITASERSLALVERKTLRLFKSDPNNFRDAKILVTGFEGEIG